MKKVFSSIGRSVLVLGVLVALAPCYACQPTSPALKSCPMTHMAGKMDCCHPTKPMNPLCKVMNQSSVAPVSQKVVAPAVTVQAFHGPLWTVVTVLSVPTNVSVDFSPPEKALPLRI